MIANASRTMALSNLGWVDGGAIWIYEPAGSPDPRRIRLSSAAYLRLYDGDGQRFAVAHHFEDERFLLTAHGFETPDRPLAAVEIRGGEPTVTGDLSAFDPTGGAFVAHLDHDATEAGGDFLIEIVNGTVRVRRLDWFDDPSYDHGYQAVISVLHLPDVGYLFGVLRSSDLVLCEPETLTVLRTVPLVNRHFGTPEPVIDPWSGHVLVIDYDTVVRLDAATLTVGATWAGQPPMAGAGMFLGDLWTGYAPGQVLVARPGAGDVVALDTSTMTVARSWTVGGQPLEAVALNGQIVARDWQSGRLLTAR